MNIEAIRTCMLACSLLFVGYVTLRDTQDKRRNWAMFYAILYILVALPIVHYICVSKGYWSFTDTDLPKILMPVDIYFLWMVVWGIIPIFFLEKKQMIITTLVIVWVDILLMPVLAEYGILILNGNWLIGEFALLLFVFLPAYLWAYSSFHNKFLAYRALMQVITMIGIFIIGLPFLLFSYGMIIRLDYSMHALLFQLLFIIAFPALVAVIDLVRIGKGTPFPYDKTSELVTTGVYAYIRNPIQWSFALIFIPMAIYHSSWYFLLGIVISIAYTIGVSDVQEYPDMEKRFGDRWTNYKSNVPKWYFSWRPYAYPDGTIYFDSECQQCSQIASWFRLRNAQNLHIKSADKLPHTIQKVTYIDHQGNVFTGVAAIARALEHIHLIYATLGWFIRFPGVLYVLEKIVYSMDFGQKRKQCDVDI